MLKAMKGSVILQIIEKESTTESGLIIKGQTETQTEGRIVSVGTDVDCVKIGDRVLVDWNRVNKITFEDQTYFATKEINIIAVFD